MRGVASAPLFIVWKIGSLSIKPVRLGGQPKGNHAACPTIAQRRGMDLCCRFPDDTPQYGALVGDPASIIEVKIGKMRRQIECKKNLVKHFS